jgi:hypothetical protein
MIDHQSAPDTSPPPPHQASPWKIALPFVVFIGIVLGTYAIHRHSLALVAVALAAVMGGVWTYGAWRARRDDARVAACSPLQTPDGATAVVISRARRDGWGSPVGYLLATETALVWTPARGGWRAGDTVAVDDGPPVELVALRADIIQYQLVAGIFSGDAVTLMLSQGVRRLRLLDPAGMEHLLALLAPDEDDNAA